MLEKTAHCFEGALFAAAAMQVLGKEPLIVDLAAENDDDHVITIFKYKKFWGAMAKSNCTTLCYREPIYRNLRELVMSYFEFYLNVLGDKTLRSYTRPININWLHSPDWIVTDEDLDPIGLKLYDYRHYPLISKPMISRLSPARKIVLEATLLGSNPHGLYKAIKN